MEGLLKKTKEEIHHCMKVWYSRLELINREISHQREPQRGFIRNPKHAITRGERGDSVARIMRILGRERGLIKAQQWRWEFKAPHIRFFVYFRTKGSHGIHKRLQRELHFLRCT